MLYGDDELNYSELSKLEHLWYMLQADIFLGKKFDYEAFKELAVRTFEFLFPCNIDDLEDDEYEDYLPRCMVKLLFHINEFSHSAYTTKEHKAAIWVARAFCNKVADGWLRGDDIPLDEDDEDYDWDYCFVVKDPYSEKGKTTFIIDARTFDLSEMI